MKDLRAATAFAQRVLSANGREFSIRKTVNQLASRGLTQNRALYADMLSHFEAAYLAFSMPQLRFSSAQTNSMPKLYAIDPGLALSNASANTNDLEQRLENAVYLELRRRSIGLRRDSICSVKTDAHGYEIDFTTSNALDPSPRPLVQVCADIADDTICERKTRALWEGMDQFGCETATLVVLEGEERELEKDGKTIRVISAHRWLLES